MRRLHHMRDNEKAMSEVSAYCIDASGYSGWADKILLPADEQRGRRHPECRYGKSTRPLRLSAQGYGLTGGRRGRGRMGTFAREVSPEPGNPPGICSCRRGRFAVGASRCCESRRGQFYAPDPTEINSSVGGTIATNASGSRSFEYGSTRRHVNAIRVALDGWTRGGLSAGGQDRLPGSRDSDPERD